MDDLTQTNLTRNVSNGVEELRSGGLGSGGVGVGGVGSVGVGVPDRDNNLPAPRHPLFFKLLTPTSLHALCVKSSLRQIVLASSRLCVKSSLCQVVFAPSRSRQVCLRQILMYPNLHESKVH